MSNFEKKVVPYLTYLGTRPILQDELQKYELHHRARIAIKPGIMAKVIVVITVLCMIAFYATSFDSIVYTAACYSYK